jgi:hypothetical protein
MAVLLTNDKTLTAGSFIRVGGSIFFHLAGEGMLWEDSSPAGLGSAALSRTNSCLFARD